MNPAIGAIGRLRSMDRGQIGCLVDKKAIPSQNIHLHCPCSVNIPPITGPIPHAKHHVLVGSRQHTKYKYDEGRTVAKCH